MGFKKFTRHLEILNTKLMLTSKIGFFLFYFKKQIQALKLVMLSH